MLIGARHSRFMHKWNICLTRFNHLLALHYDIDSIGSVVDTFTAWVGVACSAVRIQQHSAMHYLNTCSMNHDNCCSMLQAWHFNRDDVALPGIHGYLKKKSAEEREHSEKFMKYQNMRGGRIILQDIKVGRCFVHSEGDCEAI